MIYTISTYVFDNEEDVLRQLVKFEEDGGMHPASLVFEIKEGKVLNPIVGVTAQLKYIIKKGKKVKDV